MSTRNYEAMFILENNAATADFDATSGAVDAILQKHGAESVQKEKWDERKLAYEIKGQRRGTYYLTYFTADPTAIAPINEDVLLTEAILRHMVLALDKPIAEHIETVEKEREMLAEDSRKNALGGWGDRDRDRRRRGAPSAAPVRKPEGAAPQVKASASTADGPGKDEGSPGKDEGSPSKDEGAPSKDEGTPSKDEGTPSKDEGKTSEPTSQA